jgi:FHS family L-fucose permease-like MFS transporter
VVWARRKRLVESPAEAVDLGQMLGLLRRPRFAFGAACIFLYVGAEVSVGSLMVGYLGQASVMGLGEQAAGKHVPLYWGGALVGRFIGAFVLRAVSAGKLLAFVAACAIGLLLLSANTVGPISGWALLSIGLFNAIMFPTIFSLACEGLGDRAAEGSGLICIAIVGGAIVPLITGHTADLTGRLRLALAVPAICYAGILAFGAFARRPLDAMDGAGSARAAA